MPCYRPLSAYRCTDGSISFVERGKHLERSIELPCGRCIGCRLERSRQTAVRCMHEVQLRPENCMITLTYSDEFIPAGGSLHYPDFVKFMKRLRKKFWYQTVRFYMCGEYGETFGRPHYHALLFGIDFPDKCFWRKSESGHSVWKSAILERLWPFGLSEIGSATFESAAYISRYITQKVTGDLADAHYGGRVPEFNQGSRNPGIGADWFKLYQSDVYPHDYVVARGKESKPPRYYDKLYRRYNGLAAMQDVKDARELDGYAQKSDNTVERLGVREEVVNLNLKRFKRG